MVSSFHSIVRSYLVNNLSICIISFRVLSRHSNSPHLNSTSITNSSPEHTSIGCVYIESSATICFESIQLDPRILPPIYPFSINHTRHAQRMSQDPSFVKTSISNISVIHTTMYPRIACILIVNKDSCSPKVQITTTTGLTSFNHH